MVNLLMLLSFLLAFNPSEQVYNVEPAVRQHMRRFKPRESTGFSQYFSTSGWGDYLGMYEPRDTSSHLDQRQSFAPVKAEMGRKFAIDRSTRLECPSSASPNSVLKCSTGSGCRLSCHPGFQLPRGLRHVWVRCVNGAWLADKPLSAIPPCHPVCPQGCPYTRQCVAPGLCGCAGELSSDRTNSSTKCPASSRTSACVTPHPPQQHAQITCHNRECNVTCEEGYKTARGLSQYRIVCDDSHVWGSDGSHDPADAQCQPTCQWPCQNGGRCVARDVCQCPRDYRGRHCQWNKFRCDPSLVQSFADHFSCEDIIEQDLVVCHFTCNNQSGTFTHETSCNYAQGYFHPKVPECKIDSAALNQASRVGVLAENGRIVPQKVCALWSGGHLRSFEGSNKRIPPSCEVSLLRKPIGVGTLVVQTQYQCGADELSCATLLNVSVSELGSVLTLASRADNADIIDQIWTNRYLVRDVIRVSKLREVFYRVQVEASDTDIVFGKNLVYIVESGSTSLHEMGGVCAGVDSLVHVNSTATVTGGCEVENLQHRLCQNTQFAQRMCEQFPVSLPSTACSEFMDASTFFTLCSAILCPIRVAPPVGDLSTARDTREEQETTRALETVCDTHLVFHEQCHQTDLPPSHYQCPLTCPGANQSFSVCAPRHDTTCGSLGRPLAPPGGDPVCHQRCTCRAGHVLDRGVCVAEQQCSCSHAGVQYAAGDTVLNQCNTCVCNGGRWLCSEANCSRSCSITNAGHYLTFDGARIDLNMRCQHYLVVGEEFSIISAQKPCLAAVSKRVRMYSSGGGMAAAYCFESITLSYRQTEVTLSSDLLVSVNGLRVNFLPWYEAGLYIGLLSSTIISVRIDIGVEIQWNGVSRVVITASPKSFQLIRGGLCGVPNGHQDDDMMTPSGDAETNVSLFADSWKVVDSCTEQEHSRLNSFCEFDPVLSKNATDHCDVLKSHLFSECHHVISVEPHWDTCMSDSCSFGLLTSTHDAASRYLCAHIEQYAEGCSAAGVAVNWRQHVPQCGVSCPAGQKYHECHRTCARTCVDLSLSANCSSSCVSGCQCSSGLVLDANDRCVPVAQCPCLHSGHDFAPHTLRHVSGSRLQQRQICECEKARWNCHFLAVNETLVGPMQTPACNSTENMEFHDCLPTHPTTCKGLNLPTPRGKKPNLSRCVSGCGCKKGFVKDTSSGICVPPEACPCFHGGVTYQTGQTMTSDCSICTCRQRGKWQCRPRPCDGECSLWGSAHVLTFDHRWLDIEGDCYYLLARAAGQNGDYLQISSWISKCSFGDFCLKEITIRVQMRGIEDELVLVRGKSPSNASVFHNLWKYEIGGYLFVEMPELGAVLHWDYSSRLNIKLSAVWRNEVKGLCGNFNGDPGDDLLGSGGIQEPTFPLMADSFRLQEHCSPTNTPERGCELHPERRQYAAERCGQLVSSLFAECARFVDPAPYLSRCNSDVCRCHRGGGDYCLCSSLAAYGHQCNRLGVPVRWRSNQLCPLQCNRNCTRYMPCMSACPPKTCANRLVYNLITKSCDSNTCIEGCKPLHRCSVGAVYSRDSLLECVNVSSCELDCSELNGKRYQNGEIISQDDCHTCFCSDGEKQCLGLPCEDREAKINVVRQTNSYDSFKRFTLHPDYTEVPQSAVCHSGWSRWLNTHHPVPIVDGGDVETVPPVIWSSANSVSDSVSMAYLLSDVSRDTYGTVAFRHDHVSRSSAVEGELVGFRPGVYELLLVDNHAAPAVCLGTAPRTLQKSTPPLVLGSVTVTSSVKSFLHLRPEIDIKMNDLEGLYVYLHSKNDVKDASHHLKSGNGKQYADPAVISEDLLTCGMISQYRSPEDNTIGRCSSGAVTRIECRAVASGVPSHVTGEAVRCSLPKGLVCLSNHTCLDYEIRVFCDCARAQPDTPLWTPVPAALSSSAPISACLESAWTDWLNLNSPSSTNTGDFENIEDLRRNFSFCETKYLVNIQCRSVGTHQSPAEGVLCDLNHGLVCSPAMAECSDYEVRLYCNCDENAATLAPSIFDTRSCDISKPLRPHEHDCSKYYLCIEIEDGLYEEVEKSCPEGELLLLSTGKCQLTDQVTNQRPECRVSSVTSQPSVLTSQFPLMTSQPSVSTSQFPPVTSQPLLMTSQPWLVTSLAYEENEDAPSHVFCDPQRPLVEYPGDCRRYQQCSRINNTHTQLVVRQCGPSTMFNPETMLCDHEDGVMKTNPQCSGENSYLTEQMPSDSRCGKDQVWRDCATPCDKLCHHLLHSLKLNGFCKFQHSCVPGCGMRSASADRCGVDEALKDHSVCARTSNCNCLLPDGTSLSAGGVGSIYDSEQNCSVHYQCSDNQLITDLTACSADLVMSGQLSVSEAESGNIYSTASLSEYSLAGAAETFGAEQADSGRCDFWLDWQDTSDPSLGDVEAEMLPWWTDDLCPGGEFTGAECVVTDGGALYNTSGDVGVTCDAQNGLSCTNALQASGRCHNYKARFFCQCPAADLTTITSPVADVTTFTSPAADVTTFTSYRRQDEALPPEPCSLNRYVPVVASGTDESITASSSLNQHFRPIWARILATTEGRAWIPKENDTRPFLQIDLGQTLDLHGLRALGDSHSGTSVTQFAIRHEMTLDDFPDTEINPSHDQIWSVDRGTADHIRTFARPFEARYVRLYPVQWTNKPALKVELFTCNRSQPLDSEKFPFETSTAAVATTGDARDTARGSQSVGEMESFTDREVSASPRTRCQQQVLTQQESRRETPIRIRLKQPSVITAIDIEGVADSSARATSTEALAMQQHLLYIESYSVRFSSDGVHWSWVQSRGGSKQVFPGNHRSEPRQRMRVEFEVPLSGRLVDVVPIVWSSGGPGAKLHLLGCHIDSDKAVTSPDLSRDVTATVEPQTAPSVAVNFSSSWSVSNCSVCASLLPLLSASNEPMGCALCDVRHPWNGSQCSESPAHCPCLHDNSIYGVSEQLVTSSCERCTCQLGGTLSCQPIACPRCQRSGQGHSQGHSLSATCHCQCHPCPSGTLLCETNGLCLATSLWCDGKQDCPDDESPSVCGSASLSSAPDHRTSSPPPVPLSTSAEASPLVAWSRAQVVTAPPTTESTTGAQTWPPLSVSTLFESPGYVVSSVTDSSTALTPQPTAATTTAAAAAAAAAAAVDLAEVTQSTPAQLSLSLAHFSTRLSTVPPVTTDAVAPGRDGRGFLSEEAAAAAAGEGGPGVAVCRLLTGLQELVSFDNALIRHQTPLCRHVLSKSASAQWVVQAEWHCDPVCRPLVTVLTSNRTVSLSLDSYSDTVTLNRQHTVPVSRAPHLVGELVGGSVARLGPFLVFSSHDSSLRVLIKNNHDILVLVERKSALGLSGLCGDSDGSPENDRTAPSGDLVATSDEFINSWRTHSSGEDSCQLSCPNTTLISSVCREIMNSPSVASCPQTAQVKVLQRRCRNSMCTCLNSGLASGRCRCQFMEQLVSECYWSMSGKREKSWTLTMDWRKDSRCPAECPDGEVFHLCHPTLCERSCQSVAESCSLPAPVCVGGCFCQPGLVRLPGGQCGRPQLCRDCECSLSLRGQVRTFSGDLVTNSLICSSPMRLLAGSYTDSHLEDKLFQVSFESRPCSGTLCHRRLVLSLGETEVSLLFNNSGVEVLVDNTLLSEGNSFAWGTVHVTPRGWLQVEIPNLPLLVQYRPAVHLVFLTTSSQAQSVISHSVCGECGKADSSIRSTQAGVPDGQQSREATSENNCSETHTTAPAAPCTAGVAKCRQLRDARLFGACHLVLPVEQIVNSCISALCSDHEEGVFCSVLAHYATQCSRFTGFCTHWREGAGCPPPDRSCPPGTVFSGCPAECSNSSLLSHCVDEQFGEGCGCDLPKECAPLDKLSGKPNLGRPVDILSHLCRANASCAASTTPSAVTTESLPCPAAEPVRCRHDWGEVRQWREVDGCSKQICSCVPPHLCPSTNQSSLQDAGSGMVWHWSNTTCCPVRTLVCHPDTCPPKASCKHPYSLTADPSTSEDCCPSYVCSQPNNTCRVELLDLIDVRSSLVPGAEDEEAHWQLRSLGDEWIDSQCRTCHCHFPPLNQTASDPSVARVTCTDLKCPQPSNEDLLRYEHSSHYTEDVSTDRFEGCCPVYNRTACKHDNKVYQPGQSWVTRVEGQCLIWHCSRSDSASGGLVISHTEPQCSRKCEQGYEYVESQWSLTAGNSSYEILQEGVELSDERSLLDSLGHWGLAGERCCGRCVRRFCLHEGERYPVGERWRAPDSCSQYHCVAPKDVVDGAILVEERQACPSTSLCPEDLLSWDENHCCRICNSTPTTSIESCSSYAVPAQDTIGLFHEGSCVNRGPVDGLVACRGGCRSSAALGSSGTIESHCHCCQVDERIVRQVNLTCPSSDTAPSHPQPPLTRSVAFLVPGSCRCSSCSGLQQETGSDPGAGGSSRGESHDVTAAGDFFSPVGKSSSDRESGEKEHLLLQGILH